MFRFTIRDLLWLMVVVGCLLGWWLDRRLEIASRREFANSLYENVANLAEEDRTTEIKRYFQYHVRPEWGGQRLVLIISWFHERYWLHYQVNESGNCYDVRHTSFADQASSNKTLPKGDLQSLIQLIDRLPRQHTDPPTERTVLVSFQAGNKWRTEIYDAALLPAEFEKVMSIIGERFETADRHKKTAK